MTDFSFVYITVENAAAAEQLGRELIAFKLAACVNIFPAMQALYPWQGAIKSASEAVLIAKTKTQMIPALREKVQTLHHYECPCILSWQIDSGNSDYLEWLAENL